jgi:ATP-dependent exoDNAse (exonuclease V) beta subunit
VNAAGKRIPGTTTIIGRFKESGGLLHWAFKQGQSGAAQLYEERDRAGEAGTMAHDMIEAAIKGWPTPQFPGADDELLGKARNAFLQFLEWQTQSRIKIVATEHSYVSEKYQFGGTVDAIGENPKGEIVLLDWKTSNSVYQDYLIQLAAYALLLEECSEYRPKGFHLLRVAKESADFAHHYFGELEDAKQAFILMRQLYEIDGKLKKRAA